MVKNIPIVVFLISIKSCWTCKPNNKGEVRPSTVPQNEEKPLSSTSQKTFERSKDYGFFLGHFTEETVMNGEETIPHQYPWMVFVCANSSTLRGWRHN